MRRKRRVRIHQLQGPTIEGIQIGRRPIGGHYVVIAATVLEETDDQQVRAVALDAQHVEIPAGRVVLIEVVPPAPTVTPARRSPMQATP